MLNCEINGTVHFLKSHISAPGDRNSPICFPSWSFPVIFPCHNWFWSDEDNVSAPLGDVFLIKVHSFRQHIINTGRMTRLMVMTQLWNYVKLEVLDLVCILECSEFTTMNEWIYNVGIKLLGQLKSTILVFLNDWPPERWLQSQKIISASLALRALHHFREISPVPSTRPGLDRGDPQTNFTLFPRITNSNFSEF